MFSFAFGKAPAAHAKPHMSSSSDLLPKHQEHYRMSEYLAGIVSRDGVVDWRDIHPEEFHPSVFPYLVLYEVVEDEDGEATDFIYRVMGDRLIEFAKVNMTGKPLSSFPYPHIRESVAYLARLAHESKRPVFSSTHSCFDNEQSLMTERSFYPILRNGTACIFGLITVTKPPVPFSDLHGDSAPKSEVERFRLLDGPHRWL